MIGRSTKIGIIGLGLLGGSYAKGFHQAGYSLVGIDIDPEAVAYAKKMQWVQEGGDDVTLLSNCDIVISALYPKAFLSWVKDHQQVLKPGCFLTDVTGIKREVIDGVNAILRSDVEFLACHPMAGREYKGIRYADPSLFQQANFIIVPTEKNTPEAMEKAKEIASILKFAHVSVLTADQHDQMIGFLSQLTHVIAISLMNVNDNSHLAEYTGDSFRDLTRIAKINESLWPELFVANKDNLVKEIEDFTNEMNRMKEWIQKEDMKELENSMIQSTKRRSAFDKR